MPPKDKKPEPTNISGIKKFALWLNTVAGVISLIGVIVTVNTIIVTKPQLKSAINIQDIKWLSVAHAFESKFDLLESEIDIVILKGDKASQEKEAKKYQDWQMEAEKDYPNAPDGMPSSTKRRYNEWEVKRAAASLKAQEIQIDIDIIEVDQKTLIKKSMKPEILKNSTTTKPKGPGE